MKRLIGIDFGKKRIGIAMSDPMQILASPHKLVESKESLEKTVLHLIKQVPEFLSCEKVIIGLPLLMNGEESDMCRLVRKFGALLEKQIEASIIYYDERLTSKGVDMLLRENTASRKERTSKLDAAAACMLLQTYMQSSNI